MLIALALATATIALPPMVLRVRAAPSVPATIVQQTLEEAVAVWREAGVTLLFERGACAGGLATAGDCAGGPSRVLPSMLIQMGVSFEEESFASRTDALPIGWIDFDDRGDPMRQIHLSRANAMKILEGSQGFGIVSRMTTFERNMLLSRVLGRALAHELGHYLFSTKSHTRTGMMRAHHVAQDFLGPNRGGFGVDSAQKALIAARLPQAVIRTEIAQQ